MKILKAALASIGYNIITLLISLFQVLALFLICALFNKVVDTNKLIMDGTLLFFSSTLVVSIVLEYYVEKVAFPKIVEGLVIVFIPIVFIALVSTIYCGTILSTSINGSLIVQSNYIVFVGSVVYSLIFRAVRMYR